MKINRNNHPNQAEQPQPQAAAPVQPVVQVAIAAINQQQPHNNLPEELRPPPLIRHPGPRGLAPRFIQVGGEYVLREHH